MLDEWLSYYRNMQSKEAGPQIEISQETIGQSIESQDFLDNTDAHSNHYSNGEYGNRNNVEQDDDDDDDDEEDDEDEDDDEDDDDEEIQEI